MYLTSEHFWALKRRSLGKAIFDQAEDRCREVNATFSVPTSFEEMQSVFKQSNAERIIVWTPLMKISTSEYIERDWDLQRTDWIRRILSYPIMWIIERPQISGWGIIRKFNESSFWGLELLQYQWEEDRSYCGYEIMANLNTTNDSSFAKYLYTQESRVIASVR